MHDVKFLNLYSVSDPQFLNGDKDLPIYDVRNNGCTYSEAVRILLSCGKSLNLY